MNVKILREDTTQPRRGQLVFLSDVDVLFSGYRFHLFFVKETIKENNFSGSGCQKLIKRGNFVRLGCCLSNFCVLGYSVFLTDLFENCYHLKGKILESGKSIFFRGHTSVQI